ncbi:MAG TPA: alkaline phosphatase family protein, partial [Dehalococcoidales bacterium]
MILGLDAPIAPRLYKYCKEGRLPAMARVINNGVWAKNAMLPLPTITPPNWTAIATGAWPSTTGITDFNVHYPGEPLNRTHGGFYSGDVRAEFVWNAIARVGKKSVVINYPTTWPPMVKNGYQIGGGGVDVNHYFWPASAFAGETAEPPPTVDDEVAFRFAQHGVEAGSASAAPRCSLSYERIFVTQKFESGVVFAQPFEGTVGQGQPDMIVLKEPSGWRNMPQAKRALEATLVVRPSSGRYRMERPVWQMLVLDTKGEGYDKVIICDGKDAASPIAELKKGQWAPIITREFPTQAGPKKAAFTVKLLELSKDAMDIRLYHSCICALDGWSYPESLATEIKSEKGLPYPESGFTAFDRGWFDTDTVLEIAELERQWWSDACTYILKNKPWDLFIMQYHLPDHAWHSISWLMDPATAKSEAEWKKYQEVELATYKMCDRLAADLFACADENETVYALISDHGAKATNGPYPNIQKVLQDAGLLVRNADGSVNWSKTRAIGQRSVYVYVNLKG